MTDYVSNATYTAELIAFFLSSYRKENNYFIEILFFTALLKIPH